MLSTFKLDLYYWKNNLTNRRRHSCIGPIHLQAPNTYMLTHKENSSPLHGRCYFSNHTPRVDDLQYDSTTNQWSGYLTCATSSQDSRKGVHGYPKPTSMSVTEPVWSTRWTTNCRDYAWTVTRQLLQMTTYQYSSCTTKRWQTTTHLLCTFSRSPKLRRT